MIPVAEIYQAIEGQKDICHIRVSDMSGRKLFDIDGSSVTGVIAELREKEKLISYYGKVMIQGATPGQKTAHYKGCCTWYADYGKPAVTGSTVMGANSADPFAHMQSMLMCMKMMKDMSEPQQQAGWISPEVAKLQADLAQTKAGLELEKYKLQVNNDDPIKKYGSLAPMIMSMAGKTPTEIKEMISMSAMMHDSLNGQKNATAGFNLVKNDVQQNFNDLQNVTQEEKNARIQKALNEMATKIPAEDMLILTESLNANPAWAQQAVLMMKQNTTTKTEEKNPS